MYALILGLIPGDSSKKTAKFNRTAIQNAIENASIRGGDTLYIPAGKYWIYADKVGLPVVDWSIAVASNVHLVMDRNTTLVVKCSSCLSKYELFKFRNVTHSSLTGGKIDGRKGDFSKVEIQYCCGHGVSVVGESSHVIIADVQFIDCFLDGIFINNRDVPK